MKTLVITGMLTLLAVLSISADTASSKEMPRDRKSVENVDDTIAYLLDCVSKSELTFVRNGDSHTGIEASAHFKNKYQHFRNTIKTPEEFIQLAATKSMVTGQPYLVKQLDGKEILCAEWLGKILADHRKR